MADDLPERAPPLQQERQDPRPSAQVAESLRMRARRFEASARWSLLVLICFTVVGIVYYVGLPLWADVQDLRTDAERGQLEAQIAAREADRTDQDASARDLSGRIAARLRAAGDFYVSGDGARSEEFSDVAFGPDGEAVIIGRRGLILTRAAGDSEFASLLVDELPDIDLEGGHYQRDGTFVPDRGDAPGNLIGVAFGPGGEAVIVGAANAVLTRAPGETGFSLDPVGTALGSAMLAFGPDGEAVIVGNDGTTLSRPPGGSGFRTASVEGVTAHLRDIDFGPDGEAVIVGDGGTILTRGPGEDSFAPTPVAGISVDLRSVGIGPSGEAVAVGREATVVVRAVGESRFAPLSVDGAPSQLRRVRFSPDGEAVILGGDGVILTRGPEEGAFTPLRSATEGLRDIVFGPDGLAIVVAFRGLLLRAPGETEFVPLALDLDRPMFNDLAFGPEGEAIAVGGDGLILIRRPEISAALAAVGTVDDLGGAIAAIPGSYQRAEELQAMEIMRDRVQRLTAELDGYRADLAALGTTGGGRSRSLETAAETMKGYLTACAGHAPDPESVDACAAALEDSGLVGTDWWQYLAERIPAGILLLFLLATFGGLYRYNVRMAGFCHARADALALFEDEADPQRLQGLTDALAGEKVEFRGSHTPTEQVVEIAKSLSGRLTSGGS